MTVDEIVKQKIDKVWKREIISKNPLATPQENPIGFVLGGQPGAGKSNLIDRIRDEQSKNVIVINGDDFRKYHPDYTNLQATNQKDMPKHTAEFAGKMVEAILEKAIQERYNVVIEGTFRTADTPINTLTTFKDSGYQTEVLIQTADPDISYASCEKRFEDALIDNPNHARFTEKAHHDLVCQNLAQNIQTVQKSGLADDLRIYIRTTENNITEYYNSKTFQRQLSQYDIKKLDDLLKKRQSVTQKIVKIHRATMAIPRALASSNIVDFHRDIIQADVYPFSMVQKADTRELGVNFGAFSQNNPYNSPNLELREKATLYSALSHIVYNDDKKNQTGINNPERTEIEQGLKILGYDRVAEESYESGLDVALFINHKTNETIIAVRGTDPDQGVLGNRDINEADLNIAFGKVPVAQTNDLLQQVERWKKGFPHFFDDKHKVIMTGHSLGGGLTGIAALAMPETIHEAYTLNSADYRNLDFRGSDIKDFSPEVQRAIVNFNINKNNPQMAFKIFNSHSNIIGSFTEFLSRSVSKAISNPKNKVGAILRVASLSHGASSTLRMQQIATILAAATAGKYSDNHIYDFIKRALWASTKRWDENSLFNAFMNHTANRLGITEKNSYLRYNAILQKAKSGEFQITDLKSAPMTTGELYEAIKNGEETKFVFDNNMTIQTTPQIQPTNISNIVANNNAILEKNETQNITTPQNIANGIKLDNFDDKTPANDDIIEEENNLEITNTTMQDNTDGIKFGSFSAQENQSDDYDIAEEPLYTENMTTFQNEPNTETKNSNNDDFITIDNPYKEDDEKEHIQNASIENKEEILDDTAFFEDTTQNIFDKDKFAFTGKRNATQDEVNEFEKEEKEKQDGSNLKDGSVKNEEQTKEEKAQKQAQADRIRELGAKYFMERDEKKFLAVSQGRFPFSENMLKLSACVNNQLAVMNMPGNGLQYSINQSEGCFQKDIEASKRAVEKSKESLKQFSGFPMQGLLPLALLLHIIKSSYEEHKQLKYQLINFVEAKELEKLRKMTPDQLEDYFKQKTLLSGEADYTTNAQTVEDFKNTFHDEIKENLDSASKFSTNGRYENADEMLKNNFLDEKLSDDEIQNLSQTNSNEFKKDLFDTNKINTQADKISLEVCDNLSKIYNIHGNEIDKNIDFLEDQCQENLKKLANNDTIFESNKIITDKVMSQTQMQNEEAKQKIADIVNLKVDDFHRKFANTGELDWDRLEKSIDEKVKEINPNATGLGKFVVQAIDHERLTNTADTKYFLKDMGAISKIHDSLSKIDFFKNNIKDNKNAYKNMFDAIRGGKSDKLELIINSMPFNKSAYSMFNKLSSVFKTAQVSDYESNKLMITHLLPARLNFLKLHFNDGKNVKNPNFDLMSLKTSDEMREADSNKISKTSIKDLVKISANPYKYLFASNINIVETKEKFTTKDGEILKVLTKPFGGIVSQKMDNSLPVNDPHRIVGTLLSSGHTPKTIRDLVPVLDKLSFAKNIDLKALTRIFPALKELESLGVKIKGLDFANANSVAKAFQDIKTFLPKPVGLLSSFGAKMALYESFGEALKSKSFKLWNDPNFAAFKQTSDYTKSLNPTFQEMDNIKKLFGMFCVANAIKKQTKNINNLPPKEDDNINISNKSKI